MVLYKLVGRIIHQPHQLACFVDNDGAVAPSKNGSKKAGYFNIGLLRKPVWNRDGIGLDKIGRIVFRYFTV